MSWGMTYYGLAKSKQMRRATTSHAKFICFLMCPRGVKQHTQC